jgi:hypothetical protein
MTFGITAGQAFMGGSALLGGLISSSGAQSAAGTQAASYDRAAALQKEQFDEQKRLSEPYRQAGLTGQNRLMELLGLGDNTGSARFGQYARDFGMQDFQQDPGYTFRLKEGLDQIGSQARAQGGAGGGRTMMGIQKYAQGLASQEYGNAFNRYQTNRANQLQPLGSLMSSGQAAAAGQAAQAGQYGVNAGNLMGQAGQATAAGQLGSANSINNMLGSMGSMYQNQQLMNKFFPSSVGGNVTAGNAGYGDYTKMGT